MLPLVAIGAAFLGLAAAAAATEETSDAHRTKRTHGRSPPADAETVSPAQPTHVSGEDGSCHSGEAVHPRDGIGKLLF